MANTNPTQDFLELDQIREGVVILKNKNIRGILLVSSTNFALKSSEEQNSIIYQFQGFLNSLDFPCQIICQSRRLNITGYLEKMKDLEDKQTNPLLKLQTEEYREFIKNLIESQNILIKNFFVVVPFASLQTTGLTIPGKKEESSNFSEDTFRRAKNQLLQRMEFVALGLRRCGLQAVPLTSAELIELYWSLYHQKSAETGYYPEIPNNLIK